ncbi:hypothetical protein N0V93_004559 [Gnomoniopsis smithogilvyi]|uniref:Uncharacterized protein n=1 Tax=Gnomoniopsis smithogilvyi TaxID=1191159 RepID=A0A9W8YSW0_9PEZI|nr:hypothetical protein N0V93_004559 [Gnomoniopsis smithogilvyi]
MTFGNQFHMPGSFHFEGPGASTTLNANMFRPPLSPSSSSYNLAKSTGSLLSDTSMATGSNAPAPPRLGRKRTHDESNNRYPFARVNTGGARDSPGTMMDDSARAEHRYTLAGQIETPGAQITPGAGAMEDSLYSDVDYRRALGPKRPLEDGEAGSTRLVNEETGETITPREAGWTTFAFQAIGGVVGKVWEFCKGGAGSFRGFQAGGGKAFEFNGQPIPTLTPEPQSATIHADSQEPPNSPPGAYPVHDEINYFSQYSADIHEPTFSPNYFQEEKLPEPLVASNPFQQPNPFKEKEPSPDPNPEPEPERPAAKRRQTGHLNEADELRRNWVMVEEDEPSPLPTRSALSAKKPASTASSRIPAASRSNMTSRLQTSRLSTSTPKRRISAPSPRFSDRSNIPTLTPSRLQQSPASFAGGPNATPPSLSAREPASYANPRSPSRSAAPNPFSTPTGSRIPQPKLAPNPFANTRTSSPIQPRLSTGSRPSSRGSLHPSPLAQNFGSRIATPPTRGHHRNTSSVSTSSASRGRPSFGYGDVEAVQTSPRLDDEGRQLATKRFATEKRNYSRLDRLNAELQGLIRQGQEALGTTVDVDMDEGWEEAT